MAEMAKVMVAADLHLDATIIPGWDRDAGVPKNWVESFGQLGKLIDYTLQSQADFLVIAGDVFHTGKPSAEAVAMTLDQLDRLKGTSTRVILLSGNHDQQMVLHGHRTPIDAYLSTHPTVLHCAASPEVVTFDGVSFALVPWLHAGGRNHLSSAEKELKDAITRLGENFEGIGGIFGHLTLTECGFGSKKRSSEVEMMSAVVEPLIKTKDIDAGPWSVARLGHIHKGQMLSTKTGYVGSTYKVSFKEVDDTKSCQLLTFGDKGEVKQDSFAFLGRNMHNVPLGDDPGSYYPLEAPEFFDINRNDILRFVVPHSYDREDELSQAVSLLRDKGVIVQTQRLHGGVQHGVKRHETIDAAVSPQEAMKKWLEKQKLNPNLNKRADEIFMEICEGENNEE